MKNKKIRILLAFTLLLAALPDRRPFYGMTIYRLSA